MKGGMHPLGCLWRLCKGRAKAANGMPLMGQRATQKVPTQPITTLAPVGKELYRKE